jgi:hypothetical protein
VKAQFREAAICGAGRTAIAVLFHFYRWTEAWTLTVQDTSLPI